MNERCTLNPELRTRLDCSSPRLFDEVPELRDQQALEREPHSRFGSRQRDDDVSRRNAGARAAHHRGWADLLKAQHAKELAKSIETLLQEARHHLVRAVACRDSRSARRDDRLHGRARELSFQNPSHQVRIVFDDGASGDLVAGGLEHAGDRTAARVGLLGPRVADGDDKTAHGLRRPGLVLRLAHSGHCSATACYDPPMQSRDRDAERRRRRAVWSSCLCAIAVVCSLRAAPRDPFTLDRAAERWVEQTLKKLTSDEKIGQLIVPSFESNFMSTDSDAFDVLTRLVREYHVGGLHVFGASQPAPSVLLNSAYGTVILGQPFSAASIINRLQAMSSVPLLNTADFETGVGFRIFGATSFPRQMAMGAIPGADGLRLVREEARITALESRALGIQVNFAPVADVNVNARNPVINIRSYGENPERVAALVGAYVAGARDGRMIATVKHFPGHGDTDVDSHLGLPIVSFDRARLDSIELLPFRRGVEQGVEGVMAAHIVLPALDPAPSTPATFSRPILHDLLRTEMGFGGLVYTDSMSMDAVAKMVPPDEGAVRALLAGADQVLHSPDPIAAFNGIKAALASGRLPASQVDASVERVLRAKASLGLHLQREIDLNAVPATVGGRAHEAIAEEAFARSITLVADARNQVPLRVPRDASILYLSVLDYPSGWQIAAPSRTFIPELKKRWANVTSIEVSDRTPLSELDLVRAVAPRYGAVVASVFVRSTSGSGRLDLGAELVRLLRDLARATDRSGQPFVTTFFGNPYTASFVPELPATLLTYDFYDQAERAAVRAIAGEAAIGGRLPITLSPQFKAGHGLDRGVTTASR